MGVLVPKRRGNPRAPEPSLDHHASLVFVLMMAARDPAVVLSAVPPAETGLVDSSPLAAGRLAPFALLPAFPSRLNRYPRAGMFIPNLAVFCFTVLFYWAGAVFRS